MKNVKKNAILFELFWYKVFVHSKLKLLLMDSVFAGCIRDKGSVIYVQEPLISPFISLVVL